MATEVVPHPANIQPPGFATPKTLTQIITYAAYNMAKAQPRSSTRASRRPYSFPRRTATTEVTNLPHLPRYVGRKDMPFQASQPRRAIAVPGVQCAHSPLQFKQCRRETANGVRLPPL